MKKLDVQRGYQGTSKKEDKKFEHPKLKPFEVKCALMLRSYHEKIFAWYAVES